MNDAEEKTSKPFDPLEPLRSMRDAYLDAMAKTMVEAVNSETYAQATGAMLEGYLTASAPMREALDKSMIQALQQLSLPSRQEVAALAERFTNVELRLDDMDAKLDALREFMHPNGPASKLKTEAPQRADAPATPMAKPSPGTTASANRSKARRRFVRRGAGPPKR